MRDVLIINYWLSKTEIIKINAGMSERIIKQNAGIKKPF